MLICTSLRLRQEASDKCETMAATQDECGRSVGDLCNISDHNRERPDSGPVIMSAENIKNYLHPVCGNVGAVLTMGRK